LKILFFISVRGHGKGGHFHSLNHISNYLGEINDVKIISIGTGYSNIIAQNPYFLKHFAFNGLNVFTLVAEIRKAIHEFNPDIFHFFDEYAYNILRLFINSRKKKIVVTKCGGPNPDSYPFVNNLVLFSKEDLDWFDSNPKFLNTRKYLIPNRVKPLKIDENNTPIAKDNNVFSFVRICRIGPKYKKSIDDSIRMMEYLHSQGLSYTRLFIIGVVENEQILSEIKKNRLIHDNTIILLTESKYTTEASKMLYLADAVIGTGRGLMESASLGKPLLTINANNGYPTLITNKNFDDAMRTNFSERNIFKSFKETDNLQNIKLLAQNKVFQEKLSIFSTEMFNEHFTIEKVQPAYMNIYNCAITGKRMILTDMPIILRTVKEFLKHNFKHGVGNNPKYK